MARVERIFKGLFINLILLFLVYLIAFIETNLINWIFYIMTTGLIAMKLRTSSSVKSLQQSLKVSESLKLYALIAMVAKILFVSFVGQVDDPANEIC